MKQKLLIVEDDKYLLQAYQAKFESENFDLLMAHDVDEGLRFLQSTDVDLIILDLIMPVKSGTEFLQTLRSIEKHKHIPVIVATNLANTKEKELCMLYGVSNFCLKSDVSIDAIGEMVQNALQK